MIKERKSDQILVLMLGLFLLIVPLSSNAQKGYEEGFVVLNSRDTLYGFVKDRKEHPFGRLYKKIKFKSKRNHTKYKPSQLLAYKKGGSTFESLWISDTGGFLNQNYVVKPGVGNQHFLKIVQKGFLTYYYWEFEDADSGYIESVGYFKKEGDPTLVRVSQGIFGLKRKYIANFLDDYPELETKIRNKLIDNPIEIVRFYNDWKKKNL